MQWRLLFIRNSWRNLLFDFFICRSTSTISRNWMFIFITPTCINSFQHFWCLECNKKINNLERKIIFIWNFKNHIIGEKKQPLAYIWFKFSLIINHLADFSTMLVNTDKHIVLWHICNFVCIMTTLKIQIFHRNACICKHIALSTLYTCMVLYYTDLDLWDMNSQHAFCSWYKLWSPHNALWREYNHAGVAAPSVRVSSFDLESMI